MTVKKQDGFSAIEIILMVILAGVIGFGAWYVWQANTNRTTNETAQLANDLPIVTHKTFDRYGITFSYPADWTLEAQNNPQSTATILTSPDFTSAGDQTVGQHVSIGEGDYPQSDLTAENFKTKHLDPNPNPYSDYKELTINGHKAVQFYRGDSRQTVFFLPNGKEVTLTLDNFPTRNAPSAAYDEIVSSVVIK